MVVEMIMTMNLAQGVSPKKISILHFINHTFLNLRFNDGAFVCFFSFVLSNCVFLVGGRS